MKGFFTTMAVVFALFVGDFSANAYTINDTYFGGTPTHSWSSMDVIGSNNYYNTAGMNVSTAGKSMDIDIFSSFMAQVNSTTVRDDQTQLGDLFIGTGGWKPIGVAPYVTDTALTTGTNWDYAIVLNQHIPTIGGGNLTGGTVSIYSTLAGNFVKSNIGNLNPNSWVYRDGQNVQFAPTSTATALGLGTWNITGDDLHISLQDYSGIEAVSNEWAFSWAMTCANDVIQGQTHIPAPVPEPGTLVLLGAGFLCLACYGKRKNMR